MAFRDEHVAIRGRGVPLSLTHIGDGEVEASFSTADFFDNWRDAKEAIIDVGHDGRVLGIEWLGSDVPEPVRPGVRYQPASNHAVVWLVEDSVRSVAKTVRVPTTDDYAIPGELDLIGMGWEAVAAVLGDREFTVRTGFEDAAVALVSVVLVTLVFAARRT